MTITKVHEQEQSEITEHRTLLRRTEQLFTILVFCLTFLPKGIELLHRRCIQKLMLTAARLVVTRIFEHLLSTAEL